MFNWKFDPDNVNRMTLGVWFRFKRKNCENCHKQDAFGFPFYRVLLPDRGMCEMWAAHGAIEPWGDKPLHFKHSNNVCLLLPKIGRKLHSKPLQVVELFFDFISNNHFDFFFSACKWRWTSFKVSDFCTPKASSTVTSNWRTCSWVGLNFELWELCR